MKEKLPILATSDPDGGAVGDRGEGGGVVSGQSYAIAKFGYVEVADGGGAGGAGEEGLDGLSAVEDTARAAEFLEVLSQERHEESAVGFAVGVKEALFQGVECVLQLRVLHQDIMLREERVRCALRNPVHAFSG